MMTFTLPAGCRMRITASMASKADGRHRWTLDLFENGAPPDTEPRARYGSRIKRGETQRIDAAPVKVDCLCRLLSSHETSEGWEADIPKVTLDTPNDLSISFGRPAAAEAYDTDQDCVLAFEFSPATRA